MESSKPTKAIIILLVVVLLATAATTLVIMTSNQSEDDFASSNEPASDTPLQVPSGNGGTGGAISDTFRDGTYSATGTYLTPGGVEQIKVEVTLADGKITDADVTEQGETGEAQQYQSQFASGYKSQVVGKKVNEVKLDRVAGSSLTSTGFNNALNDIQKQAAV